MTLARHRPALVALLLAFVLAGCDPAAGPVYQPDGYNVRYEVISNCGANVTLQSPSGVSQYTVGPRGASDPWWYHRHASSGDFLYVSAQVDCWGGSVATRILKWDTWGLHGDEPGWYVWAQNSSHGDFVIATTSGSY